MLKGILQSQVTERRSFRNRKSDWGRPFPYCFDGFRMTFYLPAEKGSTRCVAFFRASAQSFVQQSAAILHEASSNTDAEAAICASICKYLLVYNAH